MLHLLPLIFCPGQVATLQSNLLHADYPHLLPKLAKQLFTKQELRCLFRNGLENHSHLKYTTCFPIMFLTSTSVKISEIYFSS